MNKKQIMKSVITIFLVGIFSVSISFAQDFGVITPTCVPVPGIPCPDDASTTQQNTEQQVLPQNNDSMTDQQKEVLEKMQAQRKALEEAQKKTQKKIQDKLGKQAPTIGVNDNSSIIYGQVKLLRDGKITALEPGKSGLELVNWDFLKTGKDGIAKFISEDGVVMLGNNTTFGTLKINTKPKLPDIPEGILDPNFKLEFDHMTFYKETMDNLWSFIKENPPEHFYSCGRGAFIDCIIDTGDFIYNGVGWFDRQIEKDYHSKRVVVTPTTAIVEKGTQFLVEVAPDGATTVTVFDGSVFVADLISKKVVTVEANYKITVPKTSTGLKSDELKQGLIQVDLNSIDRWWDKNSGMTKNQKILFISVVLLILAIGVIHFYVKK